MSDVSRYNINDFIKCINDGNIPEIFFPIESEMIILVDYLLSSKFNEMAKFEYPLIVKLTSPLIIIFFNKISLKNIATLSGKITIMTLDDNMPFFTLQMGPDTTDEILKRLYDVYPFSQSLSLLHSANVSSIPPFPLLCLTLTACIKIENEQLYKFKNTLMVLKLADMPQITDLRQLSALLDLVIARCSGLTNRSIKNMNSLESLELVENFTITKLSMDNLKVFYQSGKNGGSSVLITGKERFSLLRLGSPAHLILSLGKSAATLENLSLDAPSHIENLLNEAKNITTLKSEFILRNFGNSGKTIEHLSVPALPEAAERELIKLTNLALIEK